MDPGLLLNKLMSFGVSHPLVELLLSYLVDRIQYIQVNGFVSDRYVASYRVPQGSNLRPFNIFINYIIYIIHTNYLLYANDLKIFNVISNISDCERSSLNLERVV